jgi:ATP-dependent helicase/nuclease subunit A
VPEKSFCNPLEEPVAVVTPLPDKIDRDAARFELGRNVIVEAGAGTGKTTLLIDRIVFLLLGGDVEIERLVALTFTEKAAAEIKFRLAERLNQLAALLREGPLDKEEREAAERCMADLESRFGVQENRLLLIEAALHDIERAQIGTIHSFCAHLLRLFPLEAKVDPDFRVDADGRALQEHFEAEWALWLDEELGEKAPRPEKWRRVLPSLPLESLRLLANGLMNPRVVPASAALTKSSVGRLREMAERTAHLGEGQPAPKGRSNILRMLEWMEQKFVATAQVLEGTDVAVPEKPVKSASWPKAWGTGEEDYKALERIANGLKPELEPLFAEAVGLVAPFVEHLRRVYRHRGWIGFDGLLVGARDLVRDYPEVRRELKARFQSLLIDEFQDTDPLQGELLMFLAERVEDAAGTWRQIRLAPGKLFVVGDAKQSIYRFRGADIAAVEDFTSLIETQGGRRCALRTNFRSAPAIVSAINAAMTPLMQARAGLQPAYTPIQARPGVDVGVSPVWMMIEGEDKLSAETGRRTEAARIARWIDEERGDFTFRDVAIVLRTTSDLIAYLEALKGRRIPYVVEAEKYFFGTQEVSDFLNLLKAIDDPSDRVALAGLLRSPLAGFEDREIYTLARAGKLDYRKRVAGAENLFALLRGFHARAGREPLADLLRGLLRETFLLELTSVAYHHQQTASNLLKFQRMADDASERGATLKEFIDEISRAKRDLQDEGESPLADDDFDAVRILTIHKAKGLEYPVVFLPNLSGDPRRGPSEEPVKAAWPRLEGDAVVGLRLDGISNIARLLLEADEAERQKEEELRVLYVALTRPKQRLFLLGNAHYNKGSFSAALARSGALSSDPVAVEAPFDRPVGASAKPALADPERLAAAWSKRSERHAQARDKALFTHPTEHAHAPVVPRPGVVAAEESDLAAPPRALLGRLCHEVLERWDYQTQAPLSMAKDLEGLVLRRAKVLVREEAGADAQALALEGRKILEPFLESKAAQQLGDTEILGRELPVLYAREGQVVRGAIDLLVRDREGVCVVDYKTDRVTKADRAARAERYKEQGRHYVHAVERALGLSDVRFKVIFLRSP